MVRKEGLEPRLGTGQITKIYNLNRKQNGNIVLAPLSLSHHTVAAISRAGMAEPKAIGRLSVSLLFRVP